MKTVYLGLARQLKQKGLKSNNPSQRLSNFYWVENKGLLSGFVIQQSDEDDYSLIYLTDDFKIEEGTNVYPAPTADEILDNLPHGITVYKFRNVDNKGKVTYGFNVFNDNYASHDSSLADAAAKMWLHLKENKFIE